MTLGRGLVLRISRSSKGMNFGWMMVLEVWRLGIKTGEFIVPALRALRIGLCAFGRWDFQEPRIMGPFAHTIPIPFP